jgi:hypothetical protein
LRDLANRDLTESDHATDKLLDAVFLTNVCFWRESHDAVDGITSACVTQAKLSRAPRGWRPVGYAILTCNPAC